MEKTQLQIGKFQLIFVHLRNKAYYALRIAIETKSVHIVC